MKKLKVVNEITNSLEKNKIFFLLNEIHKYELQLQNYDKLSLKKLKIYERRWKQISQKYIKINLYGIEFVGIGETISRLFSYVVDKHKRSKNVFHVVLPTFFSEYKGGVFNDRVFEIFRNNIDFITGQDISFWKYVIIFHSNKIDLNKYNQYKFRAPIVFNINVGTPLISFSNEMIGYAEKKMIGMGIRKKYVCFHAREVLTKIKNYSNYPDTSVADVNINSFRKAYEYLQDLGFSVVRMGKDESRACKIEGIIDYSKLFYDQLMDFYLIANCKFLVGSASGLTSITAFWGRPVLITNLNVFCYGFESLPTTKFDLYIPKKFYSIKDKRYLNLYEMFVISNRCDRYNERFEIEGIQVIDNTEDEILKATREMNDRMECLWEETEHEIICMKKYWKIIDLWKKRHKICLTRKRYGGDGYTMMPMPICYSYLKENMYLLEVEGIK